MKKKSYNPKVLILMGSDSDLPIMEQAADFLDELEIPYDMEIASAHRSPKRTETIVKTAEGKGVKAIIAAAGMAAHLAGVVASHTVLPVIGVPIASTKITHALNGPDALLSTVQMPPGIPVATVGIGMGKNAAILACQILSVNNIRIKKKLQTMRKQMEEEVEKKSNIMKERRKEEKKV